jgi:hypothetical protein
MARVLGDAGGFMERATGGKEAREARGKETASGNRTGSFRRGQNRDGEKAGGYFEDLSFATIRMIPPIRQTARMTQLTVVVIMFPSAGKNDPGRTRDGPGGAAEKLSGDVEFLQAAGFSETRSPGLGEVYLRIGKNGC